MAFSGNFMCTSFKVELLKGMHDFTNGQDTYKLALYTNSAEPTQGSFGGSGTTMNGSVTDYSDNNQVGASGDYTTGGGAFAPGTPTGTPTVGGPVACFCIALCLI